jgi:hypothetical protein
MLRCCTYGRLPAENCGYLKGVLRDEHHLPSPKEIAKRVHFTNVQREMNKLWTIPPVDMTKEQLAEQRREKHRMRQMLTRRKANALTRCAYLAAVASDKPWLKEGKSRRTWFRHRAKERVAPGPCEQQNDVALGPSARINTKHSYTQCHSELALKPKGYQQNPASQSKPKSIILAPLNRFLLGTTCLTPVSNRN